MTRLLDEQGRYDRLLRLGVVLGRAAFLLCLLCIFLTAIQLLSGAFKMLGTEQAAALFEGLENPFAGLAVGILATVMVQSSSVTTATVVALVGGGQISIGHAVPIVMGANIGTSVTNTLVAMGHITRKVEFRRAFAGATMHDFFNLIALAILLPVELATGILEKAALALTGHLGSGGASSYEFESPIKQFFGVLAKSVQAFVTEVVGLSGWPAAVAAMLIALALIVVSLLFITKTMRRLMAAKVEQALNRILGRQGLLGMLVGAALTVAVQSSSITTSLLVPMIGAGVLTLEAGYPVTLGANVGTTVTGLIASLATGPAGLAIALVHTLFNLAGIVLLYPIPAIRWIPIRIAKALAARAVENRVWVLVYIVGVFVVMPVLGILLFKWLKKQDAENSGLAKIIREFERMLERGHQVFESATGAYLSLSDADEVRPHLIRTDQEINRLERQIRREIVVHATVYGVSEFPACLVLMSITKDAERIGDESKNILDVATFRPQEKGAPYYEQLLRLRQRVLEMLEETKRLYELQEGESAAAFIQTAEVLKDECDDAVDALLGSSEPATVVAADPVGTALCFRYYKRIISHARNIVTSIVVPVDQLDYFDESKETRNGPPPV